MERDHDADTPDSATGEGHALQGKRREAARFQQDDGSDGVHSNGYDRPEPEQAVFDLSMDYSDDETLLDWEQYAGNRRVRCCGMDVSWLQRCLPCLPWVPPEWWYKYSRRQRKLFGLACVMASVIVGTILLSVIVIKIAGVPESVSASNQAGQLRGEDLPECQWASWRLPNNATPTAYNLQLQTLMEEPFTVSGSVEITLAVPVPTLCIVLSVAAMQVTSASLLTPAVPGNITLNAELQQATIRFPSGIRAYSGTRVLGINFTYPLSQGLSGFYRSTHAGLDGEETVLATTQFESSSARRAFPCFDEPALKASFKLSMVAPTGKTVLFNMPKASSTDVGQGRTQHIFQESPKMSTYLVAFIVGDLQPSPTISVQTTLGSGVARPVTVWGTPERVGDLQTALDVAAKLLPAYEQTLNVPYALPKLDLVAIPDFAAGAMENWGLITFRETDLLATNQSGLLGRRRVTSVIAHEMAHLWFGDLVTCDYWNEIWLNEGFATYWQAAASDQVAPELDMLGTFYTDDASYALDYDSRSLSTHPLSVAPGVLQGTAGIEAMFDGISYQKGGAVLRMLRAYLNRDASPPPLLRRRRLLQAASDPWLQGLTSYLQNNQLKTATATTLWSTLGDTVGQDVAGWMQPWTYRPGFPIVNVTLGGASGLDVLVSQAGFTITGIQACAGTNMSAPNGPWWVPIKLAHSEPGEPGWHAFSECAHTHAITTLQSADAWIKLNAGQYGFYRVQYPQPLWARLANASNSSMSPITSPDLAGLLDDSFALSLIGSSPITNFLSLSSTLQMRNISEVSPWRTSAGYLLSISSLLAKNASLAQCSADLQRYARTSVIQPALLALATAQPTLTASRPSDASLQASWAVSGVLSSNYTQLTTSASVRQVRSTIVGLAQGLNDTTIASQAARLATVAIASSDEAFAVDADIRSAVYAASVGMGNASSWSLMQEHYREATDAAEKSRSLRALAYAPTRALVQRTLDYTLDVEVRSQDMNSLIAATAVRSSTNLQTAWTFLGLHWNELVAKLGGDDEAAKSMGSLLSSLGGQFASASDVPKVEALYTEHAAMLKEERYLTEAKESITAKAAWLSRNSAPACSWLAARAA